MLNITPYLELNEETAQLEDRANNTKTSLTFSESAVLAKLLTSESVCDKETLLEAGWPERVVAATSLTQCISTLRKKLEPYPEIVLKTVARRGYELHVAKQSNIKVLAVNDAKSLRTAFFDAPTRVKIIGIIPLLLIMVFFWYYSDYHQIIKQSSHWHADKSITLNIGGEKTQIPVFYQNSGANFRASSWQKHIAPESNHIDGLQNAKGFASHYGNNYSVAVCLNTVNGQCSHNLMNITTFNKKPAGLNINKFLKLAEKLEKRIRYNKIIIPYDEEGMDVDGDEGGDITEHAYHADVYFPNAGKQLIRADMSLSFIYDGSNEGLFYSSVCITDEDCLTTPIKYRLNGDFIKYHKKINGMDVDVFQVKIKQKEFIKPDVVMPSAMHFYRAIRKHNIKDKELYFYRVHVDNKTAVWINPILGNLVAWYKYEPVLI